MPSAHYFYGYWYEVRLSHLGPSDFLRMICGACGGRSVVAPWQMHHRFHADTVLAMIAHAHRCPACGVVGRSYWTTWRAQPDPDAAPPDAEAVRRWFKDYEERGWASSS